MPDTPLLRVSHLSIAFTQYARGLRRQTFFAVRDVSIHVEAGELVAVIGASGSGKSLLAHSILGLLPYNAEMTGDLCYRGEPLTPARQRALRGREIALVPQGVTFLDPLTRVEPQLRNGRRDAASRGKSHALLARYGLPEDTKSRFPHTLSGGMARRVLVATASMHAPSLVIADEPTPGLHPEAARSVLDHFAQMRGDGAGVLLITHDLEAALTVADRVVILYAGMSVEDAPARAFHQVESLRHPYTRALYAAMPAHGFAALPGDQPPAANPPPGCPFAPRCAQAIAACERPVPYSATAEGHVRCLMAVEAPPCGEPPHAESPGSPHQPERSRGYGA